MDKLLYTVNTCWCFASVTDFAWKRSLSVTLSDLAESSDQPHHVLHPFLPDQRELVYSIKNRNHIGLLTVTQSFM